MAQRLAASQRNTLSAGEFRYLTKCVDSKALPTPRLLIKNHKSKVNGEYPTRLVVPASNFTAGFANLGYRGIKHVFDSYGVNCSRFTIAQATELKRKLERMKVRYNFHTIVSFDAIEMYPSIKFCMVERAINFFATKLPREAESTILQCLKMIRFAMVHTLITFRGKYFEY